jgi:cellulose synthase/poly-beta-1,6-N-acetylglucosamine synthase-like glycosyltransferase
MNVFLLIDALFGAVILIVHIALCIGVASNMRRERRGAARRAAVPRAGAGHADARSLRPEIVVALRNEEAVLPGFLESLRKQTAGDCYLLFVDDRSTDATGRILEEFCRATGPRARVIHNTAEPDILTGKQAALDLAFASLRGDVVVLTDGDCELPPTWAEELVGHFDDPGVGIVLGRIELPEGRSFLERFQAFEQPLINQYNLGSAGMNLPTGCFGNNMAIRAEAVKETGGFAKLGYSVTEDALLLDSVCRTGRWKVRVCASTRAAAVTRPQPTWADYVNQHTRWNAGGLFSPDIVTRLSYILIVLVYLVGSLLLLPFGFLDWRISVLSLNAFLSMGILAFVSGCYPDKRRPAYFLRLLPYLFFFGFFYAFVTVRAFVRRPFDWKGASLRG